MSPPDLSKMKGFDPRLFMSYADKVGHGAAVGIVYHDHGPDWVELAGSDRKASPPSPAARIEMADLKERVRKLEAIADGVDT